MDQFIAAFRQVAPNVPQEFWEKYKQRVNFDELVELVVPIYDKYFTEEDIKVMLDYYNTPTGRKVTATTTQMTKEKMTVMQAWGRKLGTEIERELRQKGIYLQPR